MTISDQVLARVRTSLSPVQVYDGLVPTKPAGRYAVFRSNAGTIVGSAVSRVVDEADFRFWVTYVCSDLDARWQIEWMATRVRDNLTSPTSLVTDSAWITSPIQQVESLPMTRDENIPELPTLYAVDQFQLLATKA